MDAEALSFDLSATALILVDLQNFTVGLRTAPHSGREVLANGVRLAEACRAAGVLVVLVRVGHRDSGVPQLNPMVDAPFGATLYKDVTFGPDALELASELGPKPGDIIIDKYGWGSFHGTSLDTHLRRRAISTLIVAGLVSAFGVDTTMREAMARGYEQMLASDATASHTAEEHDHFLRFVAPRLARVRTTDVIIAALQIE